MGDAGVGRGERRRTDKLESDDGGDGGGIARVEE